MAVVIGGRRGSQIGKTCTCIRLLREDEHPMVRKHGPIWVVDTEMLFRDRITGKETWYPYAPDKFLMPINPRDDDSIEHLETLSVE